MYRCVVISLAIACLPAHAMSEKALQNQINALQNQTTQLQKELTSLKKQLVNQHQNTVVKTTKAKGQATRATKIRAVKTHTVPGYHTHTIKVHTPNQHENTIGYYPSALLAGNQVIAYIAGTPVVTSPFLGDRPAFDGSDYIVNISSINRDVRLMEQRRILYHKYQDMGYPAPNLPIVSLSGKAEPIGTIGQTYAGTRVADFTLGSSELDVAAALNENVEAYMAIAYDEAAPDSGGPRVFNSEFDLSLGFINIGNLDVTPIYFTAGQLFAPFGRYSSSMISAPLTMGMARTLTRPFILGYKSQTGTGPFAALYAFKGDTTLGSTGVGGVNGGYIFAGQNYRGEMGAGFISSINDAFGMQTTGTAPGSVFGGFASLTNGNENVKKIPAVDVHGNINIDRYSFTAEWIGSSETFRNQDLSFNGKGARPQALQLEAGMTFMLFDRPSSAAVGYQWTNNALALQLPKSRVSGVFNISIWKDTIESIEYRHDIDYALGDFANGAAPQGLTNNPILATGKSADTLLAQIGVYF